MRTSARPCQLAVLVCLLVLVGCGSDDVTGGDPEDLWGQTFVATSATEGGAPRSVEGRVRATVTFHDEGDERAIRWNVGCNGDGAVGLELTSDTINITEFAVPTNRDCGREINQLEAWLQRFMGSDPSWRVDGSELILTSGETVVNLVSIEWEPLAREHPEVVDRVCRIDEKFGLTGRPHRDAAPDGSRLEPLRRAAEAQPGVLPIDLARALLARC